RDRDRAAAAYRAVLELDPDNVAALNNLANILNQEGRPAAAESLTQHGIALGYPGTLYQTAIESEVQQGHYTDAATTVERYAKASPNDPLVPGMRGWIASSQHDYAATERWWRQMLAAERPGAAFHEAAAGALAMAAEVQGELGRSAQLLRDVESDGEARGLPGDYIGGALGMAWMDLHYRGRSQDAMAKVAAALARHPIASIDPEARPYTNLAQFYAAAGRVAEAQRLMAEFERVVPEGVRRGDVGGFIAAAEIARAQGHFAEEITQYAAVRREVGCGVCGLYETAQAYEKLGQPDSALAAYETVAETGAGTWPYRLNTDSYALAATYKRLGELYEARGDRVRARNYYGRFVDLWKNADPELQPLVRDVRERIVRLTAEH
ncbi:MAG TPA: tetratricopeptide repeat protein, partial [Gemmatimonadales bacterium]